MPTITQVTELFATEGSTRTRLNATRYTTGIISNYKEQRASLAKGESVVIASDNFVSLFLNIETVCVCTFTQSDNTTQVVSLPLKGNFVYAGKVSISITNPAENVSELPIEVMALTV